MKCLWTCSRNLARKGGISLLGNEDEPIFKDTLFQINLNFWLSFTICFSEDKVMGLGMSLFIGHIWEVYPRKVL